VIYTDSVPLSALQHLAFCPRQCALIHVERIWQENLLTAEGRVMHEKAHEESSESRVNIRIHRGLQLQSTSLGIHGVADIVEYHLQADSGWHPFPVEYKRGRPKSEPIDAIQLCAQALCLEEMHSLKITQGALFYGQNRRREEVVFDKRLRDETVETVMRLHALIDAGITPSAQYTPKCKACSLYDSCQPKLLRSSAKGYLEKLIHSSG